MDPTKYPSISPSRNPTKSPSDSPSLPPTLEPTLEPTLNPTTWKPTVQNETRPPTSSPTWRPTRNPSISPTRSPSFEPTLEPTVGPTLEPTLDLTRFPSESPFITSSESLTHTGDVSDNIEPKMQATSNTVLFCLPAIPVLSVCLAVMLLLFMGTMYFMFIKNDSKSKIALHIKLPVMLCFISNLVAVSCCIIVTIIMSRGAWNLERLTMTIAPFYIAAVAYSFGKFNLEISFVLRVYTVFKGSTFELSKCTVIMLFCSILLVSIFWCLLFISNPTEDSFHIPYYSYLIATGCEVIVIITILCLFAQRLAKLFLMQTHEKSIQISTNKSTESATKEVDTDTVSGEKDVQSKRIRVLSLTGDPRFTRKDVKSVQNDMSEKQTKFILVITRCILLSSIALLTTILFGFIAFYGPYILPHIFYQNVFIIYILWSMDMLMNCICLYLNFIFADKIYNKVCGLCHGYCQNMFEFCAARTILKYHLDEQNLAAMM